MAVLKLSMAPGPPSAEDYREHLRGMVEEVQRLKGELKTMTRTCTELRQRLHMAEAQRNDYVTLFQRFGGAHYAVPRR